MLNIDVHITTCTHSEVKCRKRGHEFPRSNCREWTHDERLEISKTAVESIKRFVLPWKNRHNIRLSIIDDGSDNIEAIKWLDSLKDINVFKYSHRGSSAGINDYMETVNADLIVHFEDDNILFNPDNIDWIQLCYDLLSSNFAKEQHLAVITFRSSLPSDKDNPQQKGAWGSRGFLTDGNFKGLLFNLFGNAHHVMLGKVYKEFLPLGGSSGNCESLMNRTLDHNQLKNIELQEFIYAFHSHMLSFPLIENITTEELNLSGMGIEYGIKDMHEYFLSKNKIDASKYIGEDKKDRKIFMGDYNY